MAQGYLPLLRPAGFLVLTGLADTFLTVVFFLAAADFCVARLGVVFLPPVLPDLLPAAEATDRRLGDFLLERSTALCKSSTRRDNSVTSRCVGICNEFNVLATRRSNAISR
jgi:hypothetical protein